MRFRIAFAAAVVVVGLVVVSAVVDHQQKEHERFLHFTWEAAYHQARSQAEAVNCNIPVWATHYQSRNGCQYRRLYVRTKNGEITSISSRTFNMRGYESYGGWEPWSSTASEDQVMAVLQAYTAGLDSATAAYATGWMAHYVD